MYITHPTMVVPDTAAEERLALELDRLKEKARHAKPPEPERRRRLPKLALLFLVLLVVAAAAFWWIRMPSVDAAAGVRSAMSQASQAVAEAVKGVGRLFASPTASQASTLSNDKAAVSRKPASSRRRQEKRRDVLSSHPVAVSPLAPSPDLPPSALASELASPDALLLTPEIPAVATDQDPEPDRIYTALDSAVTPPVPLQPILGVTTTSGKVGPGDMEVLIDESGTVERVSLLTPTRFQDRMLIFAMKNRRFRPAMADGHPVKYRLHVHVIS